jgi:cell fate regulator YaaT (PSP1 superfamily)
MNKGNTKFNSQLTEELKKKNGCSLLFYNSSKKYEEILNYNLKPNKLPLSACLLKTIENLYYAPYDNRNIAELVSRGINSNFFALVPDNMNLNLYDEVIVEINGGCELAVVKSLGDKVKYKRQKLGLFNESLPKILRIPNEDDLIKIEKNKSDEIRARDVFKVKTKKFNLEMKLVDVHFQFDKSKLYFFYTADGRVDFRELAKELAAEFKTRIELRQIGPRDETKKTSGIGICGRELCCSTFICNFKKITTMLNYDLHFQNHNISQKQCGICGKLKCCLTYELKEDETISVETEDNN